MRAITVARKPLSEGNIASNVLKHGTGGININACRLPTGDPLGKKLCQSRSWKNPSILGVGSVNDDWKMGRWPSNLILQHLPECHGTNCSPACPVADLGGQSGDRPSTLTGRADPSQSHGHPGTVKSPSQVFGSWKASSLGNVYADVGTASRYFKQVRGEEDA